MIASPSRSRFGRAVSAWPTAMRYGAALAVVLATTGLIALINSGWTFFDRVTIENPGTPFIAAVTLVALLIGAGPALLAAAAAMLAVFLVFSRYETFERAVVLVATMLIIIGLAEWQRRAQKAAEQAQAKFEAIVESMNDAVMVVDVAGRPADINHAAIAMLGATDRAAALAKLTYRRADGTPATDEYLLLERARAGEEAPQQDVPIPDAPGGPRVVSAVASPMRDARGRIIGAVSVSRDVTDRLTQARERESLLRQIEQEQQFIAHILANVPVGIAVVRADDFTLLSFNNEYDSSVRQARGSHPLVIGQSLLDAMPAASHDAATRLLARARDEGATIRSTAYAAAVAPDQFYDGTIQPLQLGDETPALLITAVNVTERVRGEREREELLQQVEQQAAQLAATFEAMVDGIAVYDAQGNVLHRNEAFYRLLHLEPGSAPPVWDGFIHAMYLRRADGTPMTREDTHSFRALAGETIREEVVLVRDGKGRDRFMNQNASPIRAADGTVIGAVVVFNDVTERLAQERERERLHVLMEERRRFAQAIFDTVLVALAVIDTETMTVSAANPTYIEAMPEPYRSQGVNGRALADMLPHTVENGFISQLRTTGHTGEASEASATRYAHPIHGVTYWNETMMPLMMADPATRHVLYVAADVTKEIEAQQRVVALAEESAQRAAELETVIANMPGGVAIYAADGRLLQMNTMGRQISGGDPLPGDAATDAAVRYAFRDAAGQLISFDDMPLARSLRGETVSGYEFVGQARHGATSFLSSSAPIRNAEGEITSAVVIFTDITERTHAEQERERLLREVEEGRHFAQKVIDSAPAGIVVFGADPRFTVRLANDQYLSLVQEPWRSAGVVGVPLAEFLPRAEESGILPIFRRVAETGEPVSLVEFEYQGFGERTIFYNWSLVPLRECGDRVTGLILLIADVTDRVLSRQRIEELADAAAQRAAELEAIIANMPDGVAIYGADGQLVQMNLAGRAISGEDLSPDDVLAEVVEHFDLRYPDGRLIPFDDLPLPRALHGETVSGYQFISHTGRGDRNILMSSAPITSATGEITSAVVIFSDITERHAAEQQREQLLREIDERRRFVQTVVESAPVGIAAFSADADMTLRMANDQYLQLLDASWRERGITGHGVREFVPDADAAGLTALVQQVMERGETVALREFAFTGFARGAGYFDASVVPLRESGEEITGILTVVADVTERVRSRQRIEELAWDAAQRARELETVIASIADGVMVTDAAGRIILENAAARRLTGRTQSAVSFDLEAQVAVQELRDPDGAPILPTDLPLGRAVRGETVTAQVLIVRRADTGEDRFLICSSAPVRAGSDAITGAVAVFRDITEMRQIDQMKDEFISIAAHELRTPLTAIKGYAELLERRLSMQEGREGDRRSLAVIRKQTERLSGLVNEMLDVSRIEAGRLQLNPEPFDLSPLVEEVVNNMRVSSEMHLLSLVTEPGVEVNGDTARIEQVLINLMSNAITYSPEGGEIDVRVWTEEGAAFVSVRDQGVGIAADELPHLFGRFYRAPQAGAMRSGGMGLGLYICQDIVARHGGTIRAESIEGAGSTFTFSLPLAGRTED